MFAGGTHQGTPDTCHHSINHSLRQHDVQRVSSLVGTRAFSITRPQAWNRLPTRDVKASRLHGPRGQIIRPRPHSFWPRPRSQPHGIWPWPHRNWPRGLEFTAHMTLIITMKPNRARMSNDLLEELVFLKCNDC